MNKSTIPMLLPVVTALALAILPGCGSDRSGSEETVLVAGGGGVPQASPLSAGLSGILGTWSADSVHTFDCTGTKACEGETLDCPAGSACRFVCDGLDACDDGEFNCPEGFPCSLTCEGKDACGDSNLNCNGAASCTIECGADAAACEGATVNCSSGPCEASCAGSRAPDMKGCDQATRCIRCEGGAPG